MTDLNTILVDVFESPTLNDVGAQIIDKYKKTVDDYRKVKETLGNALVRRWEIGKMVSDNYEEIITECGSQRKFAEKLGVTEAMISNDKRGYEALLDAGVQKSTEVIPFLKDNEIEVVTRNWERIGSLLNEPDKVDPKDRRPRDEKRLEDIYNEIEEIRARNEGSNPGVFSQAKDTLSYLEDVGNMLGAQDIFRSGWRSRQYLDFVKSIGFDYITGEQAENLDPHHTLIDGSSTGPHGKVADVFTIPVNRACHMEIEEGIREPTPLEIAEALIRTMALFIVTHSEPDK